MSKTSTGSGILKAILSLIAVLLVLLIAAEFGTRWYITNQIRQEVGQSSDGREAEVSLGSSPVLLGIVEKDISHVEINTPNTVKIERPADPNGVPAISGTPDAHVVIEHLDISDADHLIAKDLTMSTSLSNDFLLANLQVYLDGAMPALKDQASNPLEALAGEFLQKSVRVTGVQSRPQSGTMEVEFTDGAAKIELEPRVQDGELSFVAKSTSVFGITLPTTVSDALTQALKQAAGDLDVGLKFQGVKVLDDGMQVDLQGNDVDLNKLSAENNFGPSV